MQAQKKHPADSLFYNKIPIWDFLLALKQKVFINTM